MYTKRVTTAFLAAFAVAVLSCVIRTEHKIEAHVVLDVRYVKQQANDIESVVAGEKPLGELDKPSGAAGEGPHSALMPRPGQGSLLAALFDPASAASAAETYPTALTPELKEIVLRRKARFEDVERYKTMGCIGDKNDGYVVYRPCPDCDKDADLKKKIEKLIGEENNDRKAMYKEAARQNNLPESGIPKIQAVWAETFRSKCKPGQWIQAPSDAAELAKFQATDLGKKLQEERPIKSAEWRQVPPLERK